ncbi:type IV secretion protein Rhs [Escherichia coli]
MKKYIFLVLFLLCGCSPVDIEPARQEVNIFRGLYQTGKYSDIYKITRGLFSNDEITLIYFSEYSKRIVQEVFVFNVEDKKVKLKGYRYDSIN